jgi:hypothetical protein
MSNISSNLLGEEIGEWLIKNRKDLTPQALARLTIDAMTRFIRLDHNKQPGEARAALGQASMCVHAMGYMAGYSIVDDAQEMFRGVREVPSILPRVELAPESEGGHLADPNRQPPSRPPLTPPSGGGLLDTPPPSGGSGAK